MAPAGYYALLHVIVAAMLPVTLLSQTYSDTDSLVTTLLSDYNAHVRPVNDQTSPVTVNFSMNVFQFTDIDVIKGRISIAAMTYLSWYDERITWNPADHGNINYVLIPVKNVWSPNIVCGSPVSELDVVGDEWMNVRYFANGFTMYTPGDIIDSSCSFDVSYWPFDKQICNVTFLAFGYLGTEVSLNLVSGDVITDSSQYIHHGEWDLQGSTAVKESFNGMDYVRYQITLERRYTFYVMNIILPIVGIMILNPMVFLLPSASGERISYSITVLLSIAVFFTIISDNLPTSSAPMANIIIFILVGLGSSMLISLSVILNLRIYHRTDDKLPKWAKCIVKLVNGEHCENTNAIADGEDKEGDHKHDVVKIARYAVSQNNEAPKKQLAFDRRTSQGMVSEVGWKNVSRAIDTILLSTFCVIIIITSVCFLAVLGSGN